MKINSAPVTELKSANRTSTSGKMKILYVEDEEVLAMLVRDHLMRNGFEVHWVANGNEALPVFEEIKPDLCVLDIMLPGISGYEIGMKIRQHSKNVPIIFLTAKSESKDVVEGFKSGGNDYLKKPFSLDELMARIHNLFSLSGRSAPGHLQVGKLSFDPVRMVLQNGTDSVALSHRENELLRMLMAHIGKPIERKEILMRLWGDDHFFNSRNLDVYVTRLRKYLRMDPDVQLLTLKGVGYQLVEG